MEQLFYEFNFLGRSLAGRLVLTCWSKNFDPRPRRAEPSRAAQWHRWIGRSPSNASVDDKLLITTVVVVIVGRCWRLLSAAWRRSFQLYVLDRDSCP